MDDQVDYYHASEDVKGKLFALTLIESSQAWFKSLHGGSIDLWFEFCKTFSVHFTTRKWQPMTMVVVSGVTQGKKEALCVYID